MNLKRLTVALTAAIGGAFASGCAVLEPTLVSSEIRLESAAGTAYILVEQYVPVVERGNIFYWYAINNSKAPLCFGTWLDGSSRSRATHISSRNMSEPVQPGQRLRSLAVSMPYGDVEATLEIKSVNEKGECRFESRK